MTNISSKQEINLILEKEVKFQSKSTIKIPSIFNDKFKINQPSSPLLAFQSNETK